MSVNMITAVNIPLEQFRRPVIMIKGANALIDTGATIPMFYFPVKALDMHVFVPNQIYMTDDNGEKVFQRHPMLLSATMFEGLDYGFNTIDQRFIVRVPDNKGFEIDFKIIKNTSGNLVPVVDGVYVQEDSTAGVLE